ncbi:MAG: 7-carboxy-7-deazaguanine synthase QueE [Gammaproteobacteria bacterium]|nr:7-carboxy-7-deazaguanine synthase QueE [Gammaproteobacteria bacterium]
MSSYKVNEIFETIQGEGQYTGTASVFVRLQGCPVGCSWCDTKQTWEQLPEDKRSLEQIINKRKDDPTWCELTSLEIVALFKQQGYQAKHVVITGGEPCMFDLNSLCLELHQNGYSTQIETSGTFEIKAPKETWVTVSPKINMKGGYDVLASCMGRANEVKHPIARQTHVDELEQLIASAPISEDALIYLQPISQKTSATKLAIDTCKAKNWRLSVQVHKYLGIS